MNKQLVNWFFFILLSLIWGSSFMLMKLGLKDLSAFQVASIRIVASGLVLLPVALKHRKSIPTNKIGFVFLSGTLGSLLPSYLFCIAETHIDSALAGMLNSLTPIFVLLTGLFFFKLKISTGKIWGIVTAFIGSFLLFMSKPELAGNQEFGFALLIVLATLMYGTNVNLVHRHLQKIPSLHTAAMALGLNAIPAFFILIGTGFFSSDSLRAPVLHAVGWSVVLGIFGTALATIIFYILIKRAGAVFASLVTYGIPFVAIGWGILFGERIGWKELGCLLIILIAVYRTNKKTAEAIPMTD